MMWKKKWVWIIVLLAAILGWNMYQGQGVPILGQDALREIVYVRDCRRGYEEMADVAGKIDGERLAEVLGRYERRRGGSAIDSFWMGDVEFDLYIRTEAGPYQILLGKENSVSDGEKEYRILDGDALLEEITTMIDK